MRNVEFADWKDSMAAAKNVAALVDLGYTSCFSPEVVKAAYAYIEAKAAVQTQLNMLSSLMKKP